MAVEAPDPLLVPSHAADAAGETVGVSAADAGWRYVSFTAFHLEDGGRLKRVTGDEEVVFVLLAGRADIRVDGERFSDLGDRDAIFEGQPAAAVLAAPGSETEVRARGRLHLVVASAPGAQGSVTRRIDPRDVPVEERGTGRTRRRVHHLVPPESAAGRLIVVEVFTPGGNWSSYPPHKHDTEDPPHESYLEEVYYYAFERPQGYALQRVYTADRSLDAVLAPGHGDLVLVPRGYHMVGAPAGYDCYYLNVMAGPAREWRFTLDPDHAWLMDWAAPA